MATGNVEIIIRANTPKENEEQKLRGAFYPNGRCPDCGSKAWWKGPRGGLSINIKCGGCGSEFNVCPQARFIERI